MLTKMLLKLGDHDNIFMINEKKIGWVPLTKHRSCHKSRKIRKKSCSTEVELEVFKRLVLENTSRVNYESTDLTNKSNLIAPERSCCKLITMIWKMTIKLMLTCKMNKSQSATV